MPRPIHHRGSGRGHVIPRDWTAAPSRVVTDTLTESGCLVAIGEPGGEPVWNPTTKQVETPDVDPIYSGPGEIALVTDADTVRMVVGDEVSTRVYGVTLPADAALIDDDGAPVQVGHVIRVLADPDPLLVGRVMTLKAIEYGTRRFSRVLLATLTD